MRPLNLHPHGLGPYLDAHRQALLIILSVLELLILLAVWARWYNRKHGLRGTIRRMRHRIAEAWHALIAPIVNIIRLRRGIEMVVDRLTEIDLARTVSDSLMSARSLLTDHDDCWPYLVLLGREEVTIGIAGPGAPPAPDPGASAWRAQSPRRWTAPRPLPAFAVDEEQKYAAVPVAVGVLNDKLVVLDLACSPGIVSVHGAPDRVDQLVSAMTAQLAVAAVGGAVDRLLVTEGVSDFPDVTPLSQALMQAASGDVTRTVLVCHRPDAATADRIAEMVRQDPGLLVLVAGYVPGSRWRLRMSTSGRVTAPDLNVDAEAAPLWLGWEQKQTLLAVAEAPQAAWTQNTEPIAVPAPRRPSPATSASHTVPRPPAMPAAPVIPAPSAMPATFAMPAAPMIPAASAVGPMPARPRAAPRSPVLESLPRGASDDLIEAPFGEPVPTARSGAVSAAATRSGD